MFSRIGFLCSHRGSSMRAIVQACNEGRLSAKPAIVVSNNKDSEALKFAADNGIQALYLPKSGRGELSYDDLVAEALLNARIDLLVLSGYLRPVPSALIKRYPGRIFNIHPALLPKYGGKGMYGMFVHQAVIRAGEKESGITIHLVDDDYDTGKIVAQKKVPVHADDNAEALAARIVSLEPEFFVETLQALQKGRLTIS